MVRGADGRIKSKARKMDILYHLDASPYSNPCKDLSHQDDSFAKVFGVSYV